MKETAYLLQAALISIWWLGLAGSSRFFVAFQFDGIAPTAFWSFFAPDMLVLASLSIVRAYRPIASIEFVILGAFAYAALYCCNATLLTGSGYLPTGLMLLGLAYNVFLCFNTTLFRTSQADGIFSNAAKTLIQITCIWAVALVAIPYVLLDSFGELARPESGWQTWTGMVLFLAFSSLGLSSSYWMVRDGDGTPLPLDQTNRLVVSGPYRFVRNPMAIAGIGQGIAIALIFRSVPILVYSLVGAIVWQLVVRPVEEREMAQRFGDAYLDYRRRIPCWIPSFRRPT